MRQFKTIIVFLVLLMSINTKAQDRSADMRFFLKSSGYGALFGALAGTVSLVFEDKMGDHSINVARGTSLGLYAGMIYGYSHMNESPQPNSNLIPESATDGASFQVIPYFSKGSLALHVNYHLFNF